MKIFALAVGLVLFAGCSDDSASGGGEASGGSPGSGGSTAGGAPSAGGGGEGGEGGADLGPHRRVFVTSTTFDGTFGGLAAADAECQARADSASLGGVWVAWLSTIAGQSAATHLVHSTDPYRLVGGGQIAADWDDLVDGSIDVPIDHDETGAQVSNETLRVWTGTDVDGSVFSPCCDDWTNEGTGSITGDTSATDDSWTFIGGQLCSNLGHLYCFEQ
jgi:hypothetical protein